MPLSEEIRRFVALTAEREVRVRELVETLRGRAFLVLLLFFSLPFCTPLPLPGLSTPFGLMIGLIGLRLAMRRKPWLPTGFLDMKLPKFFPRVLLAGNHIVAFIERLLRPRHSYLVDLPVMQHLSGTVIFLCGTLLLLPLPVPFSNLFPAATVVLLAVANIGRDGFFVILGMGTFMATLLFFGALIAGGAAAIDWVTDHFRGWFEPGKVHLP